MKKVATFILSSWLLTVLVTAMIILAIAYILRFFTPEVPIQQNSWKLVTPGYKISREAVESLGTPTNVEQTKDGITYSYKSDIPVLPNKVVTDTDGVVKIIKETIVSSDKNTVDQYKKQFGEPDIVTYDESLPDTLLLNVFLKQGIAVAAHVEGGAIEEKWHFEPMDVETFLQTIGKDTNAEGHGPEPIPPEFLE